MNTASNERFKNVVQVEKGTFDVTLTNGVTVRVLSPYVFEATERAARKFAQPVRMDAVAKGTKFTEAFGGHWIADGPHASDGAFKATRSDGKTSLFAGCAEVTVGWHPQGWLELAREA